MSVCLFIDAENMRLYENELLYLKILYNIDEIFIYCDLERNNIFQHYFDWIKKYKCFFINVSSIGGKNSVDLQISLDIFEKIFKNKKLHTILLASNDKDFYPICNKLLNYKKNIILIVQKHLCKQIQSIVTGFVYLDDISIDLKTILLCFLYIRKNKIQLLNLKKLLKKINKKKIIDYPNLASNLCLWNKIFDVNLDEINLKYNFEL